MNVAIKAIIFVLVARKGVRVGLPDGDSVGKIVGLTLGQNEGSVVGSIVGLTVG